MAHAIVPQRTARQRAMRAIPWALKLTLSAALMWYLLRTVDLAGAFERMKDQRLANVLGAFGLICGQAVLGSIRWKYVVAAIGGHLATTKAVLITFVSLFFNQFLPASVGVDAVRVWQSSRAGLPMSTALTSVMLDRFGNLLSVVSFALLLLPLWTHRVQGEAARNAFVAIGVLGAAALVVLMFLDRMPDAWRRWRIARALAMLARDTRLLFLRPRFAGILVGSAMAGQCLLAGAVILLASGLEIDVRFFDCLILMPPVVVISSLPISVAGWGVRELAMVTAFGMLSVPAESALALSVLLALIGTVASLPGGLIWLWMNDRRGPHDRTIADAKGAIRTP